MYCRKRLLFLVAGLLFSAASFVAAQHFNYMCCMEPLFHPCSSFSCLPRTVNGVLMYVSSSNIGFTWPVEPCDYAFNIEVTNCKPHDEFPPQTQTCYSFAVAYDSPEDCAAEKNGELATYFIPACVDCGCP